MDNLVQCFRRVRRWKTRSAAIVQCTKNIEPGNKQQLAAHAFEGRGASHSASWSSFGAVRETRHIFQITQIVVQILNETSRHA
jgi:hypothetical protein